MTMQHAILRLLSILSGLGFACTNLHAQNANAQRKLSKQFYNDQWLSILIWTTVTAQGPLPKGKKSVQMLLLGRGTEKKVIWQMKHTLRFRGRDKFAIRLRRRAELLMRLAESVEYCHDHHGPMSLGVSKRDVLCWCCTHSGCDTRIPIDCKLSDEVKGETPVRFWEEKGI